MGVTPFWTDQDSRHEGFAGFWDGIFFEGEPIPGIWALTVTKARDLEKPKQNGIDGVTLKDKGYTGATLQATGKIWTREQLEDFELWLPRYDPKVPGSIRTPVSMYHPAASLVGIYQVYIREIVIPSPEGQMIKPSIKLEEWFPAPKPAKPSDKAKGFDGAQNANAPLNNRDFEVGPPIPLISVPRVG